MSDIEWDNQDLKPDIEWLEYKTSPDHYETLEVSPKASPDVIKKVYRVLIEKYHPDKHPESRRSWAEEMTKQLTEAFSVLIDERKRKEYDEQRSRKYSV